MTTLTHKQESFAQAVASGKNQSDAYRASYSTAKSTDKTVWEKASELAGNVKVLARIKELKEKLANKQLWTREQSVKVLADITRDADSRAGEKVQAVKELNQMHGYNEPVKIDHSLSDRTITITRATK